jgi:hypothetical protein
VYPFRPKRRLQFTSAKPKRPSVRLNIPTLNASAACYDKLCRLWQQVPTDGRDLVLDFSDCEFLRQNAVVVLGGMIRRTRLAGGRVIVDWENANARVRRNLERNGLRSYISGGAWATPGNEVRFRADQALVKEDLLHYLNGDWLGKGWVHVSDPLRAELVSTVLEVYANAFEHGTSSLGVFSCGQHYPRVDELHLAVADFGTGIPTRVRTFLGDPSLPGEKALEWALQPGNTTVEGEGRGIGLDFLREFIQVNDGQLELYSDSAYAAITKEDVCFAPRGLKFPGTLVNIRFTCDEASYHLASEPLPDTLF